MYVCMYIYIYIYIYNTQIIRGRGAALTLLNLASALPDSFGKLGVPAASRRQAFRCRHPWLAGWLHGCMDTWLHGWMVTITHAKLKAAGLAGGRGPDGHHVAAAGCSLRSNSNQKQTN